MLLLGENGWRVYRVSLYCFIQLHVNLQLSQNKNLFKNSVEKPKRMMKNRKNPQVFGTAHLITWKNIFRYVIIFIYLLWHISTVMCHIFFTESTFGILEVMTLQVSVTAKQKLLEHEHWSPNSAQTLMYPQNHLGSF